MIGENGLFVVLTIALTAAVTNAEPPQKVVGGTPAYPGELPYQVSLRVQGRHICGGSIITKRHILTAAHCIRDVADVNTLVVVTGSVNVNGGQTHKVRTALYHAQYNPHASGVPNDIAMLVLAWDIVFNHYQNKVKLPVALVPSHATATVSGWGARPNQNGYVPDLTKAQVYTLSSSECHAILQKTSTIYTSQICSYSTVGHGICIGDDGGPLVYNGQLVGIVSWGFYCGQGYPDVYTSVHHYLPWINQYLQST